MNTGYQKNIMWLLLLGAMAQAGNTWAADKTVVTFEQYHGESLQDLGKRMVKLGKEYIGEKENKEDKEKKAQEEEEKKKKEEQPVAAYFVDLAYLKDQGYLQGLEDQDKMLFNVRGRMSVVNNDVEKGIRCYLDIIANTSEHSILKQASSLSYLGRWFDWVSKPITALGASLIAGYGLKSHYNVAIPNYSSYEGLHVGSAACFTALGIGTWLWGKYKSSQAKVQGESFARRMRENDWNGYVGPIFTKQGVKKCIDQGHKKEIHFGMLAPAIFKRAVMEYTNTADIDKACSNPNYVKIRYSSTQDEAHIRAELNKTLKFSSSCSGS